MTSTSATDVFRYAPGRIRFNEALIAAMACATTGCGLAYIIGPPLMFGLLAATLLVTAGAVRRALRLSLEVTPERVVVRNYWRTYVFAWIDVTKIGLGLESMGVLPQPAVAFGLRNGEVVRAQATPFPPMEQQQLFDVLAEFAPPSVEFFVPIRTRESRRPTP